MAVVEECVRSLFEGLDEGIFEYVVSMVEDMPGAPCEDLIEALVPFLLSAEFTGDIECNTMILAP